MGDNYLIQYYQEIKKGNIIVGSELMMQLDFLMDELNNPKFVFDPTPALELLFKLLQPVLWVLEKIIDAVKWVIENIAKAFSGVGKVFGKVGNFFGDLFTGKLFKSNSSNTSNSYTTNNVTVNTTASTIDVNALNKALGGSYI